MSSIANLIAFDGATTPVSHTLVPIEVTKVKNTISALYREGLASLPVYAQVSAMLTLERLSSGIYKATSKVAVPVMESISGQNAAGYTAAPKVAYTDTVVVTGFFSERGTIAGRRLVRQLAVNISGGITTTVAPVTTGPFAELFDQLTMPN